jgi:hypothetical protein
MAEVKLNGKDLGILWKPPYRVEVTGALQPGENALEVKVVKAYALSESSKRKNPKEQTIPYLIFSKERKRSHPYVVVLMLPGRTSNE